MLRTPNSRKGKLEKYMGLIKIVSSMNRSLCVKSKDMLQNLRSITMSFLTHTFDIFRKDSNFAGSNTTRGGGVLIDVRKEFCVVQVAIMTRKLD